MKIIESSRLYLRTNFPVQLLLLLPLLLHVDPLTASFLFLIFPIMIFANRSSVDPKSNILPLFGHLCSCEILFNMLGYLFILTSCLVVVQLQAPTTPHLSSALLYPDLFHMSVDDYW